MAKNRPNLIFAAKMPVLNPNLLSKYFVPVSSVPRTSQISHPLVSVVQIQLISQRGKSEAVFGATSGSSAGIKGVWQEVQRGYKTSAPNHCSTSVGKQNKGGLLIKENWKVHVQYSGF